MLTTFFPTGDDRLVVPLSLDTPNKAVLSALDIGAVHALTDLVR